MLLGVIADDFTGASDIANTLAKGLPGEGGLRTTQFLGVPDRSAPSGIEAGVVALKSRSIPAGDAVRLSLEALRWLLDQGCRQIVFKYCSTFDSTSDGNIGPVAEALASALNVRGVVVCPAFPAAGRTVYMGHLFVRDRLLSESGMENHPLNPMTDPDLRRWLSIQSCGAIGHVGWHTVRQGVSPIAVQLDAARQQGETLVVVDALTDDDLVSIGRANAGVRLLTGGSGIALGLPSNFAAAGLVAELGKATVSSIDGPEAIMAGSCSGATRGQIDYHKARHPTLAINVDSVMGGETRFAELADFLVANQGKAPLIYSSGSPEDVRQAQQRYGRERLAQTLDTLFADTARELAARGVRRLVVAGGETSGAVVSALDLGALAIGEEIDPGVPVLLSAGNPPMALALKSGNFGGEDFFEKALERLAGR